MTLKQFLVGKGWFYGVQGLLLPVPGPFLFCDGSGLVRSGCRVILVDCIGLEGSSWMG